MSAEPLRAVVIGARCRRQGIGHHLARFLHDAGVEVTAVCGTTPATAAEAAGALGRVIGTLPAAYVRGEEMLAAERPNIAVIASPDETHGRYLAACLQHDAHVLCEKPVVWGGPDPVDEARVLAKRFRERGLHLVVNAQWPFTLPTYRELFPGVDPRVAKRFYMRMSPASTDHAMLPAALPHPLALLMALFEPAATHIGRVDASWHGPARSHCRVRFEFIHAEGRLDCDVDIQSVAEQPRPAGYGFDDAIAWREVELDTYSMSLRDGDRTVPLPDPTPLLVRSFVDRVRGPGPATIDPSVDPGMIHLLELVVPAKTLIR